MAHDRGLRWKIERRTMAIFETIDSIPLMIRRLPGTFDIKPRPAVVVRGATTGRGFMPYAIVVFMSYAIVVAVLTVAQVGFAAVPTADVGPLIERLDAPRLAEREAAEAELLGLGPAVLDRLPPTDAPVSAETRQRLTRIRRKLERITADAATNAATVTLDAKAMPLLKILAAIEKQTGNTIIDFRPKFGQPATDPQLTVRFDRTPFWQTFDQVLDEAGLAAYLYAKRGAVGVVVSPTGAQSSSRVHPFYSGPFRIEPVSIVARRDLRRPGTAPLVISLQVAWEPRLRIISLVHPMGEVQAVDDLGNAIAPSSPEAKLEALDAAGGAASAATFELALSAPSRAARRIARLDGKIVATLPGKVETFRFDKLAEAKNLVRRIAGVAVTLDHVQNAATGVRAESGAWEARLRIRFDDAGDALASHRQWIFSNETYLEASDGKRIAPDGFETIAQAKNELVIAYRFRVDRSLDGLSLVYKTPGTIVTQAFAYKLKGIELP
jgi:hypothetical protein